METGFGREHGNQNTLSAVATLAYDCRRSAYFTEQLYAALTLIDRGILSAGSRGSMHGENGQTQFLPKTILEYGTGGNLDNAANALSSTANFLRAHGWQAGAGYQPGEANFGAIQAWNAAPVYERAIALIGQQIDGRAPLGGAERVASEIRLVAHPRLSTTRDQPVNDPSTNPAAVLDPRLERSRADRKIAAAGTVRGCWL